MLLAFGVLCVVTSMDGNSTTNDDNYEQPRANDNGQNDARYGNPLQNQKKIFFNNLGNSMKIVRQQCQHVQDAATQTGTCSGTCFENYKNFLANCAIRGTVILVTPPVRVKCRNDQLY